MTHENQMIFLSIHGIKDGQKTFNCGTRYDWYIIQHTSKYTTTIVNDEKYNNIVIDMNKFDWLPNSNIIKITDLLSYDSKNNLRVIMNSSYHARRDYVQDIKTDEFKYPCVHSTPKNGVRYKYSKVNDKGHFDVSKVIFGEAGINDVVLDVDGCYGMTQGAMAIIIDDKDEGENIKKALLSVKFDSILRSCLWGNFRIEWRLFTYFKKDFWKEFI